MKGTLKALGAAASAAASVAGSLTDGSTSSEADDTQERREFPALPLSAPPDIVTFDAPPAVLASRQARLAASKAYHAQGAARLSKSAAAAAEAEAVNAEEAAADAIVARKAATDLSYVDSMTRSINRLLAHARAGPDGGEPRDVRTARYLRRESERIANQTHENGWALRDLLEDFGDKLHDDIKTAVGKLQESIESQERHADKVAKVLGDSSALVERMRKAQLDDEPPFLPKRLLRPDGTPWWPDKPLPVEGERLLVVPFGMGVLPRKAAAASFM